MRVLSVKRIKLDHPVPVYDVSVDRHHNFQLASGVFVHNSHIQCLLLTLFYKHFPELIHRGNIYVAKPPLFQIKKGSKVAGYLLDEAAREKWLMEKVRAAYDVPKGTRLADLDEGVVADATRGFTLGYLKGLGEMNPNELADTTMDPAKRTLVRVEVGDAEDAFETFRVLMDNRAVDERKAFITENALAAELDM